MLGGQSQVQPILAETPHPAPSRNRCSPRSQDSSRRPLAFPDEFGGRKSQRLRETRDGFEGGTLDTSLKLADVGTVEFRTEGKFFLAESTLFAAASKRAAKRSVAHAA